MSIDQWIAVLASSAACVSAFATFLTVREMTRQRKASYKPELIISRGDFYAAPGKNSGSPMATVWSKGKPSADGPVEPFFLSLRNIGLGPATSITLKWDFDIVGLVAIVNDLSLRNLAGLYVDYDEGVMTINFDSSNRRTYIWISENQTSFDFALSTAINMEPIMLRLPSCYTELAAAYIHLLVQAKEADLVMELPPLIANITFSDIGGAKLQTDLFLNVLVYRLPELVISGRIDCSRLYSQAQKDRVKKFTPILMTSTNPKKTSNQS